MHSNPLYPIEYSVWIDGIDCTELVSQRIAMRYSLFLPSGRRDFYNFLFRDEGVFVELIKDMYLGSERIVNLILNISGELNYRAKAKMVLNGWGYDYLEGEYRQMAYDHNWLSVGFELLYIES